MVFDVSRSGNARRKVKDVRITAASAVAKLQSPQSFNADRIAVCGKERAQVRAECWIKRIDAAVTKIADEQFTAKWTKRRGRDGHAPGRIERHIRAETTKQLSGGVEHVDKTVARAANVILLVVILQ